MQVTQNKKLIVSLLISFIIIASFTGIVGYISTNITKDSINQLVGQQSTTFAFTALNKIDVSIANKISELEKIGKESSIQNALNISNKQDFASENKLVSTRLNEKIILDNRESDFQIYENIKLRNLEDIVIASSGNSGEFFFEEILIEETQESEVFVSDIYYDDILDEQVYGIGILISNPKGQTIGSIHALINFQDIVTLIEESKETSQFASSEFDLFYDDGFLLYSTTERQEDYDILYFISGFEEVYSSIDEQLERIDDQYDEILQEFGYIEPELSEKEWEEIEERTFLLDQQYEKILEEYDSEIISETREIQLGEQLSDIDKQYEKILEEYGFIIPSLSESDQIEFEERMSEVEERYDEIYEQYNFDFTFGGKGFVIVESDNEEGEILHAYSRQKGYQEFDGLDWVLVVHTEMEEILQDVNYQRDLLLWITVVMTIASAILGVIFSRIFYRQSQKINESEKMSTIGHLSSNIAHDMRNPLGSIRSSTERIKDQNKDENKIISDEIKRINRSVKRMSHQVEGVLNYVRTTPLITDEFSVLEMLDYAKNSVAIPKNIKINLPENDVLIECDQEKLEITFENLMLNAIQAIGEKKEGGEGTIDIKVIEEKQDICIIFENDGPSISDQALSKIFEPLFTTRLKGTGLGLSSCKNIIEQHHGKITVKQDPVAFTIQIPKKQK